MNHSEIVSFIWDVANLIRDTFKRGKYQDVVLPLTVLRRLDCVLAPTKEAVLERQAEYRGQSPAPKNRRRAAPLQPRRTVNFAVRRDSQSLVPKTGPQAKVYLASEERPLRAKVDTQACGGSKRWSSEPGQDQEAGQAASADFKFRSRA